MSQLNSNFGEQAWPTPSGKESGPTAPIPGIGTPALNTPPTQNEHVGIAWREGGFDEATRGARPAQVNSVFDAGLGFESMDQSSGGGGATNGAIDSPFGELLIPKP